MVETSGTRTYYATSAFTDPANWITFAVAAIGFIAAASDLFSPSVIKLLLLVQGIIMIAARIFLADRPVSFILPGKVEPVLVKAVHPEGTTAAIFESKPPPPAA